ncbi:MAG: hypothetical protein ACYS30_19495 [Planctomycetota bacterium]
MAIGDLQRINDATYILYKAGVPMTVLKSGALVPQFPVFERDVMEKILARFSEPNNKTPTAAGQ